MRYRLLVLLLGITACAQADSRDQKARTMFKVQGLEATFQRALDQNRAATREQAKKMMDQMLTELNPTQEFQDRMNRAADKFIKTMQGERTAKEILDVVVEYYAPRFTEAELDQLIAFYQSDVAKKDAEITRAAMDNVAARFKGADEKKQHEAVSEFMQDMRVIAADCRCQRQK